MELLVILIPLMLIMFFTGRHYLSPYLDGTKQIDQIKHPMLARAQRIKRYKDVKAREIEFSHKQKIHTTKKNDLILESGNNSAKAIAIVREKHNKEIQAWNQDFMLITAEEDARKSREEAARLAEVRAKEAAAAEEERQKNLAIWTANEKVRLDRLMAEQKALATQVAQQLADTTRSRERDIQALQTFRTRDTNNISYGSRMVNVHGLFVRKLPTKASREEGNLMQGAVVGVNGWIRGEEVYGNPIWFKLANDVGWVWSGGVDNKSTSGLINYNYLNEPGDSYTTKNADGSYAQTWTEPSEMQSMVDAEIAAMKQEQAATARAEQVRNPFSTILTNMITADRISVGGATSGTGVTISSKGMAVSDREVDVFKKIKRGDYTRNFMSRKSDDFWSGTEFADPDYFD